MAYFARQEATRMARHGCHVRHVDADDRPIGAR